MTIRSRAALFAAVTTPLLGLIVPSVQGVAQTASPYATTADLSSHFGEYTGAFVLLDVQRNTLVRHNPTRCSRRFAPCSTFKIPNSLIFLETGVAKDENTRLAWDGQKRPIDAWNRDQTLQTAFRDSVVWYYQKMASRVGMKRLREYVNRLEYGNQASSDTVTGFWLDGSLTISPDEQITFLRRLVNGSLPFSTRSQEIVRRLMIREKTGDAILLAKTGTDGNLKKGVATMGWYVGYVERGKRTYIFATNIAGGENPSGRTAERITKAILKGRGIL